MGKSRQAATSTESDIFKFWDVAMEVKPQEP